MADTSTLQSTLQPEKKRSAVFQMIGGTFEDLAGDVFESITGVNRTPDNFESKELITTPVPEYVKKTFSSGSIEGFNKPRLESEEALIAEQRAAVAEAESILRQSRTESVIQEEIRYEVVGMSEEDRNRRLGLNASLRRRHTEDPYHIAELYRQIKKEALVAARQEKQASIPSPAKQPSALEGAFEGRSGTQGGGQANLSFQATG